MEVAGRVGWLVRGVLYLLVAGLLARVPSTGGGQSADRQGAFATLAESPFGGWLLGAVAVGLAGFAVWRAWAAARGSGEKPATRLVWAGTAVLYAWLAIAAVGILRGGGGGGGGEGEQAMTARVLGWPGGQLLVGAAGIVLIAVAIRYIGKGVQEKFLRYIDAGAVPDRARGAVRAVGVAGWLGRSLVGLLIGWFVLRAALQRDPDEPIGLDESLRALVGEPWGETVVWVAVAGLAAYGALCLVTARWFDGEPRD